jgi:hypothetical protein
VDDFGKPLRVVVVQGAGGEALPDRAGQVIKL